MGIGVTDSEGETGVEPDITGRVIKGGGKGRVTEGMEETYQAAVGMAASCLKEG
jgi:hypothetical protein